MTTITYTVLTLHWRILEVTAHHHANNTVLCSGMCTVYYDFYFIDFSFSLCSGLFYVDIFISVLKNKVYICLRNNTSGRKGNTSAWQCRIVVVYIRGRVDVVLFHQQWQYRTRMWCTANIPWLRLRSDTCPLLSGRDVRLSAVWCICCQRHVLAVRGNIWVHMYRLGVR